MVTPATVVKLGSSKIFFSTMRPLDWACPGGAPASISANNRQGKARWVDARLNMGQLPLMQTDHIGYARLDPDVGTHGSHHPYFSKGPMSRMLARDRSSYSTDEFEP
jgi:hypothetical protein